VSDDPDYAFKLEKAIIAKYGEETVVNPKKNWNAEKEKEYLSELKKMYSNSKTTSSRVRHKGFLISEKLFSVENNKCCNTCGKYKPKLVNRLYMLKYDCCFACYYKYYEGRR
jgi:uncharacterized GH25 family protein